MPFITDGHESNSDIEVNEDLKALLNMDES